VLEKNEGGRAVIEKVGSWRWRLRWDFHSVLTDREVESGGAHPQWGQVTWGALWFGVGSGGGVGSFP
jgi:hypothetical protein